MEDHPHQKLKKLTSREEEGTSRDDSLIDKLISSAIIYTETATRTVFSSVLLID